MTFSEQIYYALFKPSKYKELVNLKTSRFVIFAIAISLVLGIVTTAVPAAAIISGFGGFETLFGKRIAPMKYEDGELSIEKPFELNIKGTYFVIDTEEDQVADDKLDSDGYYVAFGKKNLKLALVYDHKIYQEQAFPLGYYLPEGFNNQMLIQIIPVIYVGLFFGVLIKGVSFFVKYGFYALILSLLINSINKQFNLKLTSGQVFQLCFYGETLGMVVSNFNMAMNFLPYDIVNIIMIFVSINIIMSAVVLMNPKHQV